MHYFNMNFNNSFKIYRNLTKKCTPNPRPLKMKEGVSELSYQLMQRDETMQLYPTEHPKNSRDLTNVFDFGTGRKIHSDAHGDKVACNGVAQTGAMLQRKKFLNILKKAPWHRHQSVAHSRKGRCHYVDCPDKKAGKADNKRARAYETCMKCKECSIALGKDVFFVIHTKVVIHISVPKHTMRNTTTRSMPESRSDLFNPYVGLALIFL